MNHLSDADRETIRRALRAELSRVGREMEGLHLLSGDAEGAAASDGESSDDGSEASEQERDLALEQNLSHLMEQTQSALTRLDAGVYGVCEDCGKAIARERLHAMPSATLCVSCKAAQEARA